jgi:hypothetical protein
LVFNAGMATNDPWKDTTSPDGRYVCIVSPSEWAASQWVMADALQCNEQILFNPPGDWSFENRIWTSSHTLRLEGRRFPGATPGITLILDPDALNGTIELDATDSRVTSSRVPAAPTGSRPFAVLLAWLNDYPKT